MSLYDSTEPATTVGEYLDRQIADLRAERTKIMERTGATGLQIVVDPVCLMLGYLTCIRHNEDTANTLQVVGSFANHALEMREKGLLR